MKISPGSQGCETTIPCQSLHRLGEIYVPAADMSLAHVTPVALQEDRQESLVLHSA